MFLAHRAELTSRSQAAAWVRQGRVLVNGTPAKPATRLSLGDKVEVDPPAPAPTELIPNPAEFGVLYEDDYLIVIDKPQGLSVHPGPGHPDDTLLNGLLHRGVKLSSIGGALRPGVVHRIDLGTSGVLVVAKEDATHRSLAAQFSRHTVERRYLALVWGKPRTQEGTIRSSLARSPGNRKKFASVSDGGKPAVTHWKLLATNGQISLLELSLETGRTHQIRVHLSEEGHPLLGDPLYGRSRSRDIPADLLEAIQNLPDQALHATVLGFTHPARQERLTFESQPPREFDAVRRFLIRG